MSKSLSVESMAAFGTSRSDMIQLHASKKINKYISEEEEIFELQSNAFCIKRNIKSLFELHLLFNYEIPSNHRFDMVAR